MKNRVKISFQPNLRKVNNNTFRIGSRDLVVGENFIKEEALSYPIIQNLIEYGIVKVLEQPSKDLQEDGEAFELSEDVQEKIEEAPKAKPSTKRSSTKKNASVAS